MRGGFIRLQRVSARWEAFSVMRSAKAFIVAVVVAALTLPLGAESGAGRRQRVRTTELAPGVTYTVMRDSSGPFRIRYVSVDLAAGATLDTVLAREKLPKFELTSEMATRTGAVAAINGDYAKPNGRPVHTFATDGDLAQTPLAWGRNFSTTADESGTYIGHPKETVEAVELDGGTVYPISMVNNADTAMSSSEVRLFTKRGAGAARAPSGHCLVRMQPYEKPHLAEDGSGVVEQAFGVELVRCGGRSLRPRGGVILASTLDSTYAAQFQLVTPGEEVNLRWSISWPNVLDTIGGNPTLIEAGQIVASNVQPQPGQNTAFFSRHPRTGVGTTPDGKVLLVTVDGRQKGYSVGMTLQEFAGLFERLGADWALNLDGGGSTTLAINGEVVNRPSDRFSDGSYGRERAVSSALVVLPGADPGEATDPVSDSPLSLDGSGDLRGRVDVSEVPRWLLNRRAARAVVMDPASTGGMLDAMMRAGYDLTPDLRSIVRTHRN